MKALKVFSSSSSFLKYCNKKQEKKSNGYYVQNVFVKHST